MARIRYEYYQKPPWVGEGHSFPSRRTSDQGWEEVVQEVEARRHVHVPRSFSSPSEEERGEEGQQAERGRSDHKVADREEQGDGQHGVPPRFLKGVVKIPPEEDLFGQGDQKQMMGGHRRRQRNGSAVRGDRRGKGKPHEQEVGDRSRAGEQREERRAPAGIRCASPLRETAAPIPGERGVQEQRRREK